MFNHQLSFGSPWYLLLLVWLPVLWWFSFRTLAGLGRVRRWVVLAIRTVVLLLLVLALAEVQMVRLSDRLTVMYLLDQSLSVPHQRRQAMIRYVNAAVRKHRKDDDRAGVVVFGRDAAIEIPPFDEEVQLAPAIETALDREHTNLAGAMKLAHASFPEDAAKRIVLLSDGNENVGDALQQVQSLAEAGVGVDVVAVRYHTRSEVVVERLAIPTDVRRRQAFDLKVVLSNTAPPDGDDDGAVRGRLVLSRTAGDQPVVLSDQPIVLPPGKKVFSIRQQIDEPDFYTYEARFIPDRPEDDGRPQNNRATGFAQVRGKGEVLLIEDFEHPGEFDFFVRQLRLEGLDVTVRRSDKLFSTLAELQPYDAVLLANVPREQFTDRQISMLVCNTQQLGAGMIMLGGPNSFGAGGWTGTELEKAMPVDFQIKSAKVVPVGALALVIDSSGSMTGEKVEMCKAAAIASAKTLSPRDYIGVVTFTSAARWVVPMTRAKSLPAIVRRIQRIGGGGGTNMRPGITYGFRGLRGTDASVKHMIVLTDGQTEGQGYQQLAAQIRREKITISTVAVGTDADVPLLDRIARTGGGKFYRVRNPKTLPRIFMKEARRVARPLIFDAHPVRPMIRFPHEMLSGVEEPLPPLGGFVLTSRKDNPLVEVALLSPKPVGERNSTILASWTYGLGKAVAFTSDAGARWASAWTNEELYRKLFGQMVRWSMRPAGNVGKFLTAADVDDQKVRMVITALDKDDEFMNFLNMTGTVVGPELEPVPIEIEQTAPGRYRGTFPADQAGSYFVTVSPGPGMAPIRTGVNVPYSDEFRDRTANDALLAELARTVPKGGSAGHLIEAIEEPDAIEPLLVVDTFRHDLPKATSSQDVWFYVALVCGCLFFFDVLLRRVQLSFAWVGPLAARIFRRRQEPAEVETIDRLRGRKAEVDGQIDQLRADARFEASETTADAAILEPQPSPQTQPFARPVLEQEKPDEESYTQRLLRAKEKAREKSRRTQ